MDGANAVRQFLIAHNVPEEQVQTVWEAIDSGKLRTRVGAVLPLADAREAHLMLERIRPQPKGKIVLAVRAS